MSRRKRKYNKGLGQTQALTHASAQRVRNQGSPDGVPANGNDTLRQKESVLNETDRKIIRYAIYVGSALLVTSIGYFFLRSNIRKRRRLKAEKETLSDNTPENFAKRFKMAFDNDGLWGTDVEAVRRIFVQLPSREMFDKVAQKYWELTGSKRNLFEDLEEELTTSELYEMQSILTAKPQKSGQPLTSDAIKKQAFMYARRLNAAMNYKVLGMPATDEDAIRQVLTEIPNQRMWSLTSAAYGIEYGVPLAQELDEDLGYFDFSWRDMIKKKPA